MGVTWITPVDVTPGTALSWIDVDVSAHIPVGSTGVILHITNDIDNTGYDVHGIRKNGSTDNRVDETYKGHMWGAIGVDASRIFEAYIASVTTTDIYLIGYFDSDAVFFTNAPDKSLSTLSAWTDIDISANTGVDTAIGAFWEKSGGISNVMGFRNNGSTDTFQEASYGHGHAVIGVDGSEICEGYINNANVDFFLNGYLKAGAIFNTNATDLSLGTVNSWLDLPALPSGATGGFIEMKGLSGANFNYGLRKNGSAENIFGNQDTHPWAMVECDASQLIEGKTENLAGDFWLVGYTWKPLLAELADSVTLSDEITKLFGKEVAESISISDVMAMLVSIAREENISIGDAVTAGLLFFKELADTLTVSDAIDLLFGKEFTEGVTLTDAISLIVQLTKAETMTVNDAIQFLVGIAKTENITLADALSQIVSTMKAETMTLTDLLAPYAFRLNQPLPYYKPKLLIELFLDSGTKRIATDDLYIEE